MKFIHLLNDGGFEYNFWFYTLEMNVIVGEFSIFVYHVFEWIWCAVGLF